MSGKKLKLSVQKSTLCLWVPANYCHLVDHRRSLCDWQTNSNVSGWRIFQVFGLGLVAWRTQFSATQKWYHQRLLSFWFVHTIIPPTVYFEFTFCSYAQGQSRANQEARRSRSFREEENWEETWTPRPCLCDLPRHTPKCAPPTPGGTHQIDTAS